MPVGARSLRGLAACATALAAGLSPWIATAQIPLGTAFTYQGRLGDGASPATGVYDLQFSLFDAPSGGAQAGSTITREDVVVIDVLVVLQ